MGEARPVIVRFLQFPDRKLVFRKARELESDTAVKVYSDLPKEISERRKKQWPRLKKAREEGKIAFFLANLSLTNCLLTDSLFLCRLNI